MSSKTGSKMLALVMAAVLFLACNISQPPAPPDHDSSQSYTEGEPIAEEFLRIEPGNFVDYGGEWADFLLKTRIQRIGQGALGIAFHANQAHGTYFLLMEPSGIFLQRESAGQINQLAVYEAELNAETWQQLELEMLGSDIRVFYAEEMVIEYVDPDPLPPGGLSFETMGDLTIELEQLVIEPLGDMVLQSEDETNAETEVVEAAQPEPDQAESQPQVSASDLTWVRLGGPPGGTGYDIRYNFEDPNIWYVTDANSGVHISYDDGQTWVESNTGLPGQSGPTGDAVGVFCLTVDPHDPQIVWIGTIGHGHIYRSTDGGKTWEQRDNGITLEYDQLTIRGFTVDPRSSDIVYMMAETNDESLGGPTTWLGGVGGVVYKTTDAGENWEKIWDGGMPSSLARYLWINPNNPDVLYVSTGIFDRSAVGEAVSEEDPFGGLGVLKSTDGGKTWRILNKDNGLRNLYIGSLYMHPDIPDVLLAAAGNGGGPEAQPYLENLLASGQPSPMGVYRTENGGETWVQTLAAKELEVFSAVELCPSDANIGYAATRFSMYRTEDAGITWQLTASPWSPPGVSAGFPIDMQCDPRNVNRVFVNNYGGGNYLSEDGGKSWTDASEGYTGAQIFGIDLNPNDPARIYAMSFSGLWRSDDGGNTWTGILFGPDDFDAYRAIAVDPNDSKHIFSGQYGFIESYDGGANWTVNWDMGTIYDGEISPESTLGGIPTFAFASSDTNRMYVGFSHELCALNHEPNCTAENQYTGPVLMVSQDGGNSWTRTADANLADRDIRDLAVDPTNEDIVYAASDLGVFKSENGGKNWAELPAVSQETSTYSIAVDPANPQHVLIGVDRDGAYQSLDGGMTWKNASAGMEPNGSVSAIVFDPANPMVVYASDFLSGVYRSEDGGKTWGKINNGLHSRAISEIVISADGNHLYAGSNEDGMYRLDINGVPPS